MNYAREQALKEQLALVSRMSVPEAMDLLKISESTARRLFQKLEKEGYCIRTHGGIQAINQTLGLYSFSHDVHRNMGKTTAIAREACKYLEQGDIVFFDSGMITQCMCMELIQRIRRDKLFIKVYTNSLANLKLLSPHLQVHLIGGEYRDHRRDFCGYLTEKALEDLYFTKTFVEANGYIGSKTFTTTDFETARTNQIAMRNSQQTFMLVDSSNFGRISHVPYINSNINQLIITDNDVKPSIIKELNLSKTQIVSVNK